jgi:hypothetical protein
MTGLPLGIIGFFSGPSTASCVASTLCVGRAPYLITCVSMDRPWWLGFLVCLAGTQHAWFIRLPSSTRLIVDLSDSRMLQLIAR